MSLEVGEYKAEGPVAKASTAARAGADERASAPMAAVRDARLMLAALWLGAAVFFSAAVAPSAFAVLRRFALPNASEIAGSIVTRTLSIVNTGGFIISLLLMASAFLFHRTVRRSAFYAEIASLAVIAAATGIGEWVIAARMRALRLAMGAPIDAVAADNPLRVAFNELHGYSVTALAVAIIAAAVALLLIARRAKSK